jgi:hypothetical protein
MYSVGKILTNASLPEEGLRFTPNYAIVAECQHCNDDPRDWPATMWIVSMSTHGQKQIQFQCFGGGRTKRIAQYQLQSLQDRVPFRFGYVDRLIIKSRRLRAG